ncbi:MAG TPA: protein translocase subunit SecF, partial [Acidimicrobiales bacterium]
MSTAKRGLWTRLYHGETAFDFIGRKNQWFALSGAVILIGLASLLVQGLNLGIDFRGGTAWSFRDTHATVAGVRGVMAQQGLGDATVQLFSSGTVTVQADLKGKSVTDRQGIVAAVQDKLAGYAKVTHDAVSVNDVGPTWGHDITAKAERALALFFVAIVIYISLRFEWKMALAAIVAVVHDILVTVGIYSLFGFPVTPATVVAFLTILGYSLYDTIVVFDKVEENTRGLASTGRLTYTDTVNLSMNQVLMRSINTSFVAILPILSILVIGAYILGAATLKEFGLALFVGLTTGAYSSIFIASPLLAVLKEREPRYATIRQRLASRGATGSLLTPAAAAAAAGAAAAGGGRSTTLLTPKAPRDAVVDDDLGVATAAAPGPPPRPRQGPRPGGG